MCMLDEVLTVSSIIHKPFVKTLRLFLLIRKFLCTLDNDIIEEINNKNSSAYL